MKRDNLPRPVRNESGIEIRPLYSAADVEASGGLAMLGEPGAYPFTRGIHPLMYRKQPFTMRQYTGFGNAADTKSYCGTGNHRGNRANGKIAVALRHLGESIAGTRFMGWKSYCGHHLVGLTSGRQHADLKFFRGQHAGGASRLQHHTAPKRRQAERQLRTRIRMRNTAAHGAATAGLEMPDMRHRQAQQWHRLGQLRPGQHVGLGLGGADLDLCGCFADIGQRRQAGYVDQVFCFEQTKIHHRHQR